MAQVDFSGKWHNQHKSEMELQIAGDGRVTGKYRTGVGSPTPAEEFPLVGFARGDQISFTVDFSKYGTLTAWVGQHRNDGGTERVETLWHLSENVPDAQEPAKLWNSVTTGADLFARGAPPLGNVPLSMLGKLKPSHPLRKPK